MDFFDSSFYLEDGVNLKRKIESININKMIQDIEEPEEMPISLDNEFMLLKCSSACHVKLRNEYFYYETIRLKERIAEEVRIKDLFSCNVVKEPAKCPTNFSIILNLLSYPMVKGQRQKNKMSFKVCKDKNWENNLEMAEKWKDLIIEAMHSIPGGLKSTINYENIRTTRPLFGNKDSEKRFVVYVNPKSGTGISAKIYKNEVKPMLLEAGIQHNVVMTTDKLAAYKSVHSLDLTKFTGIVVISGDGLLYEIYNGLLHRKDWYDAISFPVSIIPGGSGNGLATSIAYILSEPYFKTPILVSTLNILNPIITPMDLVIVNTSCKKRLLSFLSISIGFLADVDIESELLRAIGPTRFILWSLKGLCCLRTYRCRLSYKIARKMRCQKKDCSPSRDTANEGTNSQIKSDKLIIPKILPDLLQDEEDDDEFYPDYAKIFVDKSFTDPNYDVLAQPVPSNWKVIEDDFVFIFAAFKPFIGKESFISPLSSLSDGVIYLWVMRKCGSKKALLNFLLSISHGPEPNEYIQRIPVSALRIEPLTKDGNLVVDGELIDYGPIQASLLPSKGSLMTRPL